MSLTTFGLGIGALSGATSPEAPWGIRYVDALTVIDSGDVMHCVNVVDEVVVIPVDEVVNKVVLDDQVTTIKIETDPVVVIYDE